MKTLIVCLTIAALFFCFSMPFIIRANARTRADQIIYGRQMSTEKQINRCISILTWTNKQITSNTENDILRLMRLRDMLKEMQVLQG